MNEVLGVVALLGSGVTAGVLFAVALSVLPALFAMETGTYVYAHKLLGRNWDPTMPVIVLSSTLVNGVLAVTVSGTGRPLFAASAVLLLGVSGVSHLCNVPINRRVKAITDPAVIPADWEDPRPLWRKFHYLRTVLSVVALVFTAAGVAAI
ncbi:MULTISPECIES: anthrone oxygenase family protein [unclassified Streptomyces]|uniref:anthrone oxygenase family protein n=1 Tax=Streptomyces sp. NPDC006544 TaxID=3154583 RepID=UPI0033AA89F5